MEKTAFQNINEQKSNQMVLEGIVTLLKEIEAQKNILNNLDGRIGRIEQRLQTMQQSTSDTIIMTNNIVNDIEDVRNNVGVVVDKIDSLDYTVRNLRIFKYYGGE